MADFCQQCSIEIFGEDFKELKPAPDRVVELHEGHGFPALCEGCGITLVGKDGECVYAFCDKHGDKRKQKNA